MTGQIIPQQVADEEDLGRGIFNSERAKRYAKGRPIAPKEFKEKADKRCLSVDRLSFCDSKKMCEIGDLNAENRNQQFHGWAVIKASIAGQNGRSIRPAPIDYNPYHANIDIPISAEARQEEEWTEHSMQLALFATWKTRP